MRRTVLKLQACEDCAAAWRRDSCGVAAVGCAMLVRCMADVAVRAQGA